MRCVLVNKWVCSYSGCPYNFPINSSCDSYYSQHFAFGFVRTHLLESLVLWLRWWFWLYVWGHCHNEFGTNTSLIVWCIQYIIYTTSKEPKIFALLCVKRFIVKRCLINTVELCGSVLKKHLSVYFQFYSQ